MPAPIVIAGIIAGAVAIGNAIGRGVQAKKARREQRRISDLNRSRLLEDRQYNEPKQQMQRFQDSNLNPNLIYGSGQQSAGVATGGETTEQTREFAPLDLQPGPAVEQIANVRRQKLQNDNIESATHLNVAKELQTHEQINTSKYTRKELRKHEQIRFALQEEKLKQESVKSQTGQQVLENTNFYAQGRERQLDREQKRAQQKELRRQWKIRPAHEKKKLAEMEARIVSLNNNSAIKELAAFMTQGSLKSIKEIQTKVDAIYQKYSPFTK